MFSPTPSRADQISKCDGTKKIEKWKSEEKTCSINVKVGAYVYVTYMSVASLLFFDIGHELYNFYASPGAKNGLFCVFDDLKFVYTSLSIGLYLCESTAKGEVWAVDKKENGNNNVSKDIFFFFNFT